MFKCKICSQILCNPVTLTCGETICQNHTEEVIHAQCLFYPATHYMPDNGFQTNKFIQKLIEMKLQTLNINISVISTTAKNLSEI